MQFLPFPLPLLLLDITYSKCSQLVGLFQGYRVPFSMQSLYGRQTPWMGFHISPVEALYLWGMVSPDDRAKHGVNQKLEGITNPPGSTLIGEVSDGSE